MPWRISEHKIRKNCEPYNNIDLTGYEKFEYQPTGTSHGGTGFYVKSDLDFKVRDDLNLNSPGNFEAMLVVRLRGPLTPFETHSDSLTLTPFESHSRHSILMTSHSRLD